MKVILNECQFVKLFENSEDEGFKFSGMKGANPSVIEFDPSSKGYSDTRIFKPETKEFNIYYEKLPKCGLESINLYFLGNMNINKAVKHGVNVAGEKINVGNEKAQNSIEYFKKRSAYYITRILNKMGVIPDIFVTPQSSSNFNKEMIGLISMYYPNGNVMEMPNALRKNPYNLEINMNSAIELGMTQDEIAKLQNRIDNIKKDEDIRNFRRKIEVLKSEIASLVTGKRGRPRKEIYDKRNEIDAYNTLIKANRRRGRDSTLDSGGNIKGMQIKNLDDKQRRAIDGLFVFNDIDYPSKTYFLNGNEYTISQSKKIYNKIVVIFDDNLSSGSTLDMACSSLQKMGAKMIVPITLGVIPLTSYDKQSRIELSNKRKMRH